MKKMQNLLTKSTLKPLLHQIEKRVFVSKYRENDKIYSNFKCCINDTQ